MTSQSRCLGLLGVTMEDRMMWCEKCQATVSARKAGNSMMKTVGIMVMVLAVPESIVMFMFLPPGPTPTERPMPRTDFTNV